MINTNNTYLTALQMLSLLMYIVLKDWIFTTNFNNAYRSHHTNKIDLMRFGLEFYNMPLLLYLLSNPKNTTKPKDFTFFYYTFFDKSKSIVYHKVVTKFIFVVMIKI